MEVDILNGSSYMQVFNTLINLLEALTQHRVHHFHKRMNSNNYDFLSNNHKDMAIPLIIY